MTASSAIECPVGNAARRLGAAKQRVDLFVVIEDLTQPIIATRQCARIGMGLRTILIAGCGRNGGGDFIEYGHWGLLFDEPFQNPRLTPPFPLRVTLTPYLISISWTCFGSD